MATDNLRDAGALVRDAAALTESFRSMRVAFAGHAPAAGTGGHTATSEVREFNSHLTRSREMLVMATGQTHELADAAARPVSRFDQLRAATEQWSGRIGALRNRGGSLLEDGKIAYQSGIGDRLQRELLPVRRLATDTRLELSRAMDGFPGVVEEVSARKADLANEASRLGQRFSELPPRFQSAMETIKRYGREGRGELERFREQLPTWAEAAAKANETVAEAHAELRDRYRGTNILAVLESDRAMVMGWITSPALHKDLRNNGIDTKAIAASSHPVRATVDAVWKNPQALGNVLVAQATDLFQPFVERQLALGFPLPERQFAGFEAWLTRLHDHPFWDRASAQATAAVNGISAGAVGAVGAIAQVDPLVLGAKHLKDGTTNFRAAYAGGQPGTLAGQAGARVRQFRGTRVGTALWNVGRATVTPVTSAVTSTYAAARTQVNLLVAAYDRERIASNRGRVAALAHAAAKRIGAAVGVIFNAVISANPIALVAIAIAAAVFIIYKYWKPITAFFRGVWKGFTQAAGPVIPALKRLGAVFAPILNPVMGLIGKGIQLFKGWVKPVDDASGAAENLGVRVGKMLARMLTAAVDTVTGIINLFTSIPDRIGKAWDNIRNRLPSWLFGSGKEASAQLGRGIAAGAGQPVQAIEGVAKQMGERVPQSPVKRGPLRNLHRLKWGETIAMGMRAEPMVAAMRRATTATLAAVTVGVSAMPALPHPRFAPGPRLAAGAPVRGGAGGESTIQLAVHVHLAPGTSGDVAEQARRGAQAAAPELVRLIERTIDARESRRARTSFQQVA